VIRGYQYPGFLRELAIKSVTFYIDYFLHIGHCMVDIGRAAQPTAGSLLLR
jgi:hypothetical protein